MNNIELYINNSLCEIINAEKLGIRLNRILINPAELNTKDAQYSYSIIIPSTNTNDEIFGFANVEEVKDKFNHDYNALLYVDSVLIFGGKFRISEIDKDGNFKGNLLIPAKKTIKEIFGDTKMNELKIEWAIPFKEMVSSLNRYNTQKGIPECIFPYVLYGLLPKVPKDSDGNYSAKDVWDETVRLGIEDFPPSINCLQAISRIFETLKDKEGNPQKIGGSAFDDARLKNLYMSYSNPTDYVQEWNWGDLATMYIRGRWANYEEINGHKFYETKAHKIDQGRQMMVADLFDSSMTRIEDVRDSGTNIIHSLVGDGIKTPRKSNTSIVIPKSGLYKISLDVKMNLYGDRSLKNQEFGGSFRVMSAYFSDAANDIQNRAHEIKIVRDFGTGDFNIESMTLDASYYKPNLPQEENSDLPQYFPVPGKKCVQFIDPSANEKLLSGFRWGDFKDSTDRFPKDKYFKDTGLNDYDYLGRILAIKSAWSWDLKYSQKEKIYSAINNVHLLPDIGENGKPTGYKVESGYWVYGLPETNEDIEGVTEDEIRSDDQDYSSYPSSKFRQELNNTSSHTGLIESENNIETSQYNGTGRLHQIVWLNKGERLTLVTVSDSGVIRRHNNTKGRYGWLRQDIDFQLEISPFKTEASWITVGNNNKGYERMNWNEPANFQQDKIDLVKFLPSDQKVDEWLENFCKAFNLRLSQIDNNKFELNVKQPRVKAHISSVVDLDNKAGIFRRSNQPLGLPAIFDLGFKINEEEEGFESTRNNGGGKIETGSLDGTTVKQTSTFSYNWFKRVGHVNKDSLAFQNLRLPIISNKEVWNKGSGDYREMQSKIYTNYAQRFWYKDDNQICNLGAIWKVSTTTITDDKAKELVIPQLKESSDEGNPLILNYKNEPNTIYQTYFNVIATNESNYTDIECYLSPDEYEKLDGARLVKLNNDLYYIASIEGYDPLGKNKTKLRLIRKM